MELDELSTAVLGGIWTLQAFLILSQCTHHYPGSILECDPGRFGSVLHSFRYFICKSSEEKKQKP